jgi:hypothetical protein
MGAEERLAAALLSRSMHFLPSGKVRVLLDQALPDDRPGPHSVGYVQRLEGGGLLVRLIDTEAGRTARVLLDEDLVDVGVEDNAVWLR